MPQPQHPQLVAEIMLSWLDLDLVSCTELESLWAGYGHILAIRARPAAQASSEVAVRETLKPTDDDTIPLILKLISPVATSDKHDEGHLRKMFSYQVEQCFYTEIAPHLDDSVAVAKCLVSTRDMRGKPRADELEGLTATLMTDLRPAFPVSSEKRAVLTDWQVPPVLNWLANFHGGSWDCAGMLRQPHAEGTPEGPDLSKFLLPPKEEQRKRLINSPDAAGASVWLNGGYTYFATRQTEYERLKQDNTSDWSRVFYEKRRLQAKEDCNIDEHGNFIFTCSRWPHMVADFLTPRGRRFESYIHGDVKSENLFTTAEDDRVAFFDFQYVGLGLGVCDLAKLFTCSVPLQMLTSWPRRNIPERLEMDDGEESCLRFYRARLLRRVKRDEAQEVGSKTRVSAYENWDTFLRHWETALVDWCRFQACWGFWGNWQWLEARVRFILADKGWKEWLRGELAKLRDQGELVYDDNRYEAS